MEAAITTRHPLGLRRTTNRLPQPWSSKMWFRPASTSFILMRPLLPPPPTPSLEEKSGTVREMASGNKRLTAPFECWFRLSVFFFAKLGAELGRMKIAGHVSHLRRGSASCASLSFRLTNLSVICFFFFAASLGIVQPHQSRIKNN